MDTDKNGEFKANPILLTLVSILLKGGTDMTCREKLMIEHPECVSHVWVGGCRGCPEDFGYLPPVEECSINRHPRPDQCTKCWDREIPGTTEVNKCSYQAIINAVKPFADDNLINFYFDPKGGMSVSIIPQKKRDDE